MSNNSTINSDEIIKFNQLANDWWNPEGKCKPLHLINPVRIRFIKDKILTHFSLQPSLIPFSKLKIIDIGCGGGLLSIPLSRLGGNVTAIDASEKSINVARSVAELEKLYINFECTNIENFQVNSLFDVVLCLEVVEHVNNLPLFFKKLSQLIHPEGMIILSTINRTLKSRILAIGVAEYILKYLPVGTHDFNKFLTPATISSLLIQNNISLKTMKGISFNLFARKWYLSDDITVNYILYASKKF